MKKLLFVFSMVAMTACGAGNQNSSAIKADASESGMFAQSMTSDEVAGIKSLFDRVNIASVPNNDGSSYRTASIELRQYPNAPIPKPDQWTIRIGFNDLPLTASEMDAASAMFTRLEVSAVSSATDEYQTETVYVTETVSASDAESWEVAYYAQ